MELLSRTVIAKLKFSLKHDKMLRFVQVAHDCRGSPLDSCIGPAWTRRQKCRSRVAILLNGWNLRHIRPVMGRVVMLVECKIRTGSLILPWPALRDGSH